MKEGLLEPQTTATIRVHGSDKFTFRRRAYPSRSVHLKRLRSGAVIGLNFLDTRPRRTINGLAKTHTHKHTDNVCITNTITDIQTRPFGER